jgi:hypothetical protein
MSQPLTLERRIKALRLPKGPSDQTRAMYSNLKRHGARMPPAQAEKLIALIKQRPVYGLTNTPSPTNDKGLDKP